MALQQIAVQSMTATDSTQLYSVALSKDLYAQRLYYNSADSGVAIQHGLATGTISLGYFGTNTAFVNVFKSADDRAVLSSAYGSLTSDLLVGRNATISGNAWIGTSLTVGSSLQVAANSYVSGSSSVTGSQYIGTNLIVTSTITGTALQITGPFASITGNVNIGTSLTVGSSLQVLANAYVTGSSTVSGSQYIGTNLIVNSTITGTALQITGPFASITGNVNIGTSLTVGSSLQVLANSYVTGSSSVSGSQYIGTNLMVNNNASITNTLYANSFVSNFGSITNLTAGHAIIMNDLIVEGNTSYVNTAVSTFEDLNLQLGLNHVRTVIGTLSGGTFLLNGTEDAGTSLVAVGAFALMNGPDQFTTGTSLGYEPVLQVTTSTLTAGTYSVTFTKWDGGSQTAVQQPTDIGFPSGYNFSQNITSLGQIATASVYGKAGLSFNTYNTLSSGAYQNNTKAILFDDGNDRVDFLNESKEVVDMNIMGTTRTGTVDTPYYCVNNNAVLNPNNLILDTTFATNSAIYLNASSTTTSAVGTWRMRIDSLNRVIWERLSSTGWRAAFKITSPF